MESQLARLEERIAGVQEDVRALQEHRDTTVVMASDIRELKDTVKTLVSALQHARGAWWAIAGIFSLGLALGGLAKWAYTLWSTS